MSRALLRSQLAVCAISLPADTLMQSQYKLCVTYQKEEIKALAEPYVPLLLIRSL